MQPDLPSFFFFFFFLSTESKHIGEILNSRNTFWRESSHYPDTVFPTHLALLGEAPSNKVNSEEKSPPSLFEASESDAKAEEKHSSENWSSQLKSHDSHQYRQRMQNELIFTLLYLFVVRDESISSVFFFFFLDVFTEDRYSDLCFNRTTRQSFHNSTTLSNQPSLHEKVSRHPQESIWTQLSVIRPGPPPPPPDSMQCYGMQQQYINSKSDKYFAHCNWCHS